MLMPSLIADRIEQSTGSSSPSRTDAGAAILLQLLPGHSASGR
uniref:Uncharacterized protein n=1 Tax=Arundo donax TaxID=35708 RepID=A0A0A8YK65_ARUDO